FGERSVGTLSRGQRQRVALARALVHAPSVLLLDEPWSGLDSASAKRLERVLEQERERGTTVIVVTHSMDVVERLGGRQLWLERDGVVAGFGSRRGGVGSEELPDGVSGGGVAVPPGNESLGGMEPAQKPWIAGAAGVGLVGL